VPTIFLSHSSVDVAFSHRLADDLRAEGISVWLDDADLRAGDSVTTIEQAISDSRFLVVVVSNASTRSDWVEKEIAMASAVDDLRIIPFVIENVSEKWAGRLAALAIADARISYRNALWRVISVVTGRKNPLITAKRAVELVKTQTAVTGELVGISQQGVATVCGFANQSDWRLCNAGEGVSRVWIVEMYDSARRSLQSFVVVDEHIESLADLHPLDSDSQPDGGSPIVMSRVINPGVLPSIASTAVAAAFFLAEIVEVASPDTPAVTEAAQFISKRYVKFRPVAIARNIVDSDVAVRSAASSSIARRLLSGHSDLFPMMKLEADARHGNAVLWKVSFFDSSLTESVLTVGVDATTGAVRFPAMQGEIVNANFLHVGRNDNQDIVLSISNQLRAFEARPGNPRPSIRDALKLASDAVQADAVPWQLAFVSTTGVLDSLPSPNLIGVDRLMRADGTAGQWVVEMCGLTPTEVTDGARIGYEYDLRQVIVTAEGAAIVERAERQVFTVPLHRCPMPPDLAKGFDAALSLASRSVVVDFEVLSVAHSRPPSGLAWYFRFYNHEGIVATMWVTGDGSRVVG
jgi:hypothetical protein